MPQFQHPFEPIYNAHSQFLILGTFPSVKSRESQFYYAHSQNRFWKLITHLTQTDPIPASVEEKKQMLLKHHIALWDIIQSCRIYRSSDYSIADAVPVDLSLLLSKTKIKTIFANGSKAYQLCKKFSIKAIKLPSTSPANATYRFENLVAEWGDKLLLS